MLRSAKDQSSSQPTMSQTGCQCKLRYTFMSSSSGNQAKLQQRLREISDLGKSKTKEAGSSKAQSSSSAASGSDSRVTVVRGVITKKCNSESCKYAKKKVGDAVKVTQ